MQHTRTNPEPHDRSFEHFLGCHLLGCCGSEPTARAFSVEQKDIIKKLTANYQCDDNGRICE